MQSTDSPRPLTRSIASLETRRRSARLQNNDNRRNPPRSSPRSQSPFLPRPTKLSVRRGTKKPKRPSATSLHHTTSIPRGQLQAKRSQPQHPGSRERTASGRSSVRIATAFQCHPRGSSRVRELEELLDSALQAKQALAAKVREHKINSAQSTLNHLEDYFTCPLCFEIMACPYSLIPRNCGHTFCATCILKWFFSRLHKGCGGWHEAVECPLCRAPLPHTQERTPRSISCFPFTPNRTAGNAIRGLINAISHELTSASVSSPLSDWCETGRSKQEWSNRERAGRTEMTSVAAQWNTLEPADFVHVKNRLQV